MRKVTALCALLLGLLLAPGALSAPAFSGYEVLAVESRTLAQGLELWRYDLVRREELPRYQRLHLLLPRPGENPALRFRVASKGGQVRGLQATSLNMAWLKEKEPDLRPLAAINGDFFDIKAGGPLGLTVDAGRALSSGEFEQGWSLGFTAAGEARIGQPRLSLYLSATRKGQPVLQDLPIDALNALRADVQPHQSLPDNAYQARGDNRLVLYTSDYYRSTMANDGGYELRLKTEDGITPGRTALARVSAIHKTGKVTVAGTARVPQGMKLGAGYLALSATGGAMDSLRLLRVGDDLSLRCEISPGWEEMVTILGGGRPDGGPLLIRDGVIQPENTTVDDYLYFYPSAHGRTAAGIRQDGSLFLLVAEAYQPGVAEGLSVAELARILLDLGAVTALNLDGGPSSTLALNIDGQYAAITGSVRGTETPVGNSLVIAELIP